MKHLKDFYDDFNNKNLDSDLKETLKNTDSTLRDESSVEGKAQLNFSAPLDLIKECNSLKPKVLALYANPKYQNYPSLLINAEINELFTNDLRLHVMIDAITTIYSLINNITNITPEIILYSGHILQTNPISLFLHNEQNLRRGELYNINNFIKVLKTNINLKLVILLACYSYKIIDYLKTNDTTLNCCFITIQELAHDSAMLSFLKGCSSTISNIYSQDQDINKNIEEIFIAGIKKFKLDKYNIGNTNTENYGYGDKLNLNDGDRVLIYRDSLSYPLEGTIQSEVKIIDKNNCYDVNTQNGLIENVKVNNIALALHGTPSLIKKIEGTWQTIRID